MNEVTTSRGCPLTSRPPSSTPASLHLSPLPSPPLRTEVLESPDQDISAMTVAADIVPIDQLTKHIGRKVCGGGEQGRGEERN